MDEIENLRNRLVNAGDAARHLYRTATVSDEDRPWWDQLLASVLSPPTHPRYGNVLDTGDVIWAADFAEAQLIRERFGFPIALENADGA
ncbi:hypothetical protein F8O07_06980 [Pseudoclavibacter sp. CFCC 13796]|uniref:hypothetical protein n=1 Tax=Pseudoclavibacter sp. CFCC 13796 TaxID=2615179 RepID=UPI001301434C|nr:hypothetical protein [Pseudoclavibacter sp. CFCC 13796]KAB1661643.1 hypothetical protein F8O07_06980 [Pseudoclavibacter sp. CFCC 13796]